MSNQEFRELYGITIRGMTGIIEKEKTSVAGDTQAEIIAAMNQVVRALEEIFSTYDLIDRLYSQRSNSAFNIHRSLRKVLSEGEKSNTKQMAKTLKYYSKKFEELLLLLELTK